MMRCLSLSTGARAMAANPAVKVFAHRVGDDKVARRVLIDVFLAIHAAQPALLRGGIVDDIELVGGILPFGRIAGDAIGMSHCRPLPIGWA